MRLASGNSPALRGRRRCRFCDRIRDVGLAARDLLHMPRVHKQQRELVLEDRPDRLPKHPGRLHRHLLHPMSGQPIAQTQQAAHGYAAAQLGDMLLAASPPHAGTRTHAVTCALCTSSAAGRSTIVSTTHLPHTRQDETVAQGPPRTDESDKRAQGNNPELRGRPTRQTNLGLTSTKNRSTSRATHPSSPFSSTRDRPTAGSTTNPKFPRVAGVFLGVVWLVVRGCALFFFGCLVQPLYCRPGRSGVCHDVL